MGKVDESSPLGAVPMHGVPETDKAIRDMETLPPSAKSTIEATSSPKSPSWGDRAVGGLKIIGFAALVAISSPLKLVSKLLQPSKEKIDDAQQEKDRLGAILEGQKKAIEEKKKDIAENKAILDGTYEAGLKSEISRLEEEIKSAKGRGVSDLDLTPTFRELRNYKSELGDLDALKSSARESLRKEERTLPLQEKGVKRTEKEIAQAGGALDRNKIAMTLARPFVYALKHLS